jgi:hypothetical protein
VVWCGVVWCGVVWCGVVWCGVVWCGVSHTAGSFLLALIRTLLKNYLQELYLFWSTLRYFSFYKIIFN